MSILKRNPLKLVTVLLLLALLGSLGLAQEPVTVTIFVGLGTGTSPEQFEPQMALQERFNSTHDEIQIEFFIVPHDTSEDQLTTMIAGGNPPDLVGPNGVSTIALFLDNWADITPFIEAEQFDTSDFYPSALGLNAYAHVNTGLPLGLFPSFIFYNVDIFDAEGVAYPPADFMDTSWTFDEVRERAMLLTLDGDGNNATSPDFDSENIVQWGYDDSWASAREKAAQWGSPRVGSPTTEDYMTAIANNEHWVQGLQWYSDGIHVDHFIPDAEGIATYESAGIGTPLDGGLIGMFHSHTWYLTELGFDGIDFDVEIAPVPFNPSGTRTAPVHADNFTIPEASENKETAWEVMKWLTSPEQIVDVCLIYGCIPARISVSDEFRAALEANFPDINYDVIFESINYLDDPNHESWTPQWGRMEDAMGLADSKLVTGENTDAQAVLDEANATIQALLDEYWDSQ